MHRQKPDRLKSILQYNVVTKSCITNSCDAVDTKICVATLSATENAIHNVALQEVAAIGGSTDITVINDST